MEHFNRAYVPVEKTNQPAGKSDGNFLKVAGIIGLVMASPFIAFIAFFVIFCVIAIAAMMFGMLGTLHLFAPWAMFALMAICFVAVIKDRITGKYKNRELKQRIETLQAELSEAKKQILELEEGADFHRKLAETNSKIARSDYPVNVNLSVTKSDNSVRR